MKILITTGIYPPRIGGPAQYAKNLKENLELLGNVVSVKTFNFENYLPTGLRHIFFFFKIIPKVLGNEIIFCLDTFSVGLPTVAICKMLGKKCIIRTGGDFLWEQYLERTKKKILLKDFYKTENNFFTIKEKIIFILTKWTLNNVSHTIYSTDWQRKIFVSAYSLDLGKTSLIENYYGPKESDFDYKSKIFIGSTRKLFWKNHDLLDEIFAELNNKNNEIDIFLDNMPYPDFIKKMSNCFAVILISYGDISPNMILDAIRLNRPFICTKEVGIYERIKEIGIFVDPLDKSQIKNAILEILSEEGYSKYKERVRKFCYTHTWEEIALEFLKIVKKVI